MFTQAVVVGLRLAASPEVIAACLLVAGLGVAALAALKPHLAHGFSVPAIGHNLLSGVGVALLTAFLLPRFMGQAEATPAALLAAHGVSVIAAGLFAGVVISGFNLAPIVGRLVAASAGAQVFILGLIVLRSLSESPLKAAVCVSLPLAAFPGLTITLGYVLIAWGWSMAAKLAADWLGGHTGEQMAAHLRLAAAGLGWLGGLTALLMYASYLHLAAAALRLRCSL